MIPILNRINELSRIERSTGLSDTEKLEQAEIRTQYLQILRGQLFSTLLGVSVMDELGNDVTPKKLIAQKIANTQ
ncbi:DUF896 domain-containing protein [Paenibacillus sp. GCM10023248]|uniref:DUF896 domain-containing protein n=1 Tax=unclassified Paenibacillus TaxID=185978 RepID=UPI0023785F35|nr:DUF896 domain-containing protein [Paenibacillus sp. MAHUQ-63]MDD9269285.1 DUF896 domain-containing protein [Paenibacillus sp. MAHUQ-63]